MRKQKKEIGEEEKESPEIMTEITGEETTDMKIMKEEQK